MKSSIFSIKESSLFKQQLLHWASGYNICCYLDNNHYPIKKYHSYECLVAAGVQKEYIAAKGQAFEGLKDFLGDDWCFGYFGYDLKNEVEALSSENFDGLYFPDIYFFKPEYIIALKVDTAEIYGADRSASDIFTEIQNIEIAQRAVSDNFKLHNRISREEYISTVTKIRQHIEEGDVYEMNYCQEFYAENAVIDPVHVFRKLNDSAKAPFSAFLKLKDKFLLCASPERFLGKQGQKLISQPIKGTIKRGKNAHEDEQLKQELKNDIKERAENVMIVDLVRNDLTRSARTGTINVEELFGIYTFETVHQMISTVTAELQESLHPVDAIKHAFPMGSMTGAPKVMAMELIEQYEQTKRGLFSGAVGYFSPEMDFDFNVVIRSILYNASEKYISLQTGGAITYDSVPEKEYEESLLKAENLRKALED